MDEKELAEQSKKGRGFGGPGWVERFGVELQKEPVWRSGGKGIRAHLVNRKQF